MRLLELVEELDFCKDDSEVFVEVNGIVHKIHYIQDTSQGVIFVVDSDEEDREMR